MEKKYNSLKEALPSLLGEHKNLDVRINQLAAEINKLGSNIEKLDAQISALKKSIQVKEERLARTEQITARKKEEWREYCNTKQGQSYIQYINEGFTPEEASQMVNQTTNLIYGKVKKGEVLQIMILKSLNSLSATITKVCQENEDNREKLLQLVQEMPYMLVLDNFILRLIGATINISSIVNFKFNAHESLFGAAFNDMLDTNNLAWIYKFSKNNEGILKENMHVLIEKVIKTNIPAYMYLIAVKFDNIPDEDMKHLIVAIVASNDKKYIDYLLIALSQKGVSKEVKDFIISLNHTISAKNMFDYDNTLADELEKSLLEDDYETLNKLGISCEDGEFVYTKAQNES